jgi:hypothetical protein
VEEASCLFQAAGIPLSPCNFQGLENRVRRTRLQFLFLFLLYCYPPVSCFLCTFYSATPYSTATKKKLFSPTNPHEFSRMEDFLIRVHSSDCLSLRSLLSQWRQPLPLAVVGNSLVRVFGAVRG